MTEFEQMNENERIQFNEFKRRMNMQAAQAELTKLEYEFTDALSDKASLRRACQEANSLKLGAICVLSGFVKQCVNFLGAKPQTSLIACVSFPHGGDSTKTKVAAVKNCINDGADEVEVTAPVSFVRDGNWSYVRREFKKLKKAAKKHAVRINIQSSLLTEQEVEKVCGVAADCGITSLRTCSGVYGGITDGGVIGKMHSVVKDKCTIKADGVNNITDMETAVNMGAGIIGSKNAAALAHLILQTAEY